MQDPIMPADPVGRRTLLAAGLALAATPVRAQAWPSRALSIIVPFPPGGLGDLAARPVAAALERALGVPAVVLNRPGGGGRIGGAAAARAAPDGHTLLCTVSSLAILPEADRILGRPPAYEATDFVPLARIAADPVVLAVPAAAPWPDAAAFLADARQRPGAIPYASTGAHGTAHVAMEMLAGAAGASFLHVPFQGAGPAVTALLSGTVQASAIAPGLAAQHVQAGRLQALAGWGTTRLPHLPEMPTWQELGLAGVEYYIWAGLFAPAATPPPVLVRLRAAAREAVLDEATARILGAAGTPVSWQDGPDFAAFLAADTGRVLPTVRRIGPIE
jgi:tripartite-type tricarboxylate transporter receptor subunit TctC